MTNLFACFRSEIICKADDIKNGTKNATRGREGEKLQYTCDPGYVLDGAPVLTCTSSATWDKPKPKCQDGACEYPKLLIALSLPRVINFKFPLQSYQKCNHKYYNFLESDWSMNQSD